MRAMRAMVLLPALLACALASRRLHQEWELWKSKHDRTYKNEGEEEFRRRTWEATWHKVMNHNLLADRGNKSYRLEMNHFADMTVDERNSRGCLKLSHSEGQPMEIRKHHNAGIDLPKAVDWRKENCVTPVKNQGLCGSCWAFATVGTLESHYCIKNKKLVELSEQQLVDCDSGNDGCCGGLPVNAFNYVSEHGIMKSTDYEYSDRAQRCSYNKKEAIKMKMSKFYILPGESNMAAAVAFDGPLTVGFGVNDDFQLFDGEGIYNGGCAAQPNHAIIIVGYGTEDDEDYWIIKNSWGTEWGDEGFAKVQRNTNQCYIGAMAATADILGAPQTLEE